MRASIVTAVGIVLVGVSSVLAQQSPMYDYRYYGPVNYYGQPTYQPAPTPAGAQAAMPAHPPGLVQEAAASVQNVGGFLWGYMPASLRGVQPQPLEPRPGDVFMTYVPGAR
jgi:hypothetical protein